MSRAPEFSSLKAHGRGVVVIMGLGLCTVHRLARKVSSQAVSEGRKDVKMGTTPKLRMDA